MVSKEIESCRFANRFCQRTSPKSSTSPRGSQNRSKQTGLQTKVIEYTGFIMANTPVQPGVTLRPTVYMYWLRVVRTYVLYHKLTC